MAVPDRAHRPGALTAAALALAWLSVVAPAAAAERPASPGPPPAVCCLPFAAETVRGVGAGAVAPLRSVEPQAPESDEAAWPAWVPQLSFALVLSGTAILLWGAARARRRRPR